MRFFVAHDQWEVQGATGALSAGEPNQDAWLVTPWRGSLRAAVIDGCWPHPETPDPEPEINAGLYAAQWTRLALSGEHGAAEALAAANAHLFARGPAPWAPQATVCAVEWRPSGRLQLVAAGDCAAWGQYADDEWRPLFESHEMYREGFAEQIEQAKTEHASTWWRETYRVQEQLLDAADGWAHPPVGRQPELGPAQRRFDGLRAVVLATDGVTLSAEACAGLLTGTELSGTGDDWTWMLIRHRAPAKTP